MALPEVLYPEANDSTDNRIAKIHAALFRLTQGTMAIAVDTSGTVADTTINFTSVNTNTSGSVAAGAKSVTFQTDGSWSGTINGVSFGASLSKVIAAPPGYVLPAIPYTRAAGTVTIDVLLP